MLCTFTTMLIVREVIRLGHVEDEFRLFFPVHKTSWLSMATVKPFRQPAKQAPA